MPKVGFSKESHKMLTGPEDPRLTHIVKLEPREATSIGWIEFVDEAHLSTWLDLTGVASLGSTMLT